MHSRLGGTGCPVQSVGMNRFYFEKWREGLQFLPLSAKGATGGGTTPIALRPFAAAPKDPEKGCSVLKSVFNLAVVVIGVFASARARRSKRASGEIHLSNRELHYLIRSVKVLGSWGLNHTCSPYLSAGNSLRPNYGLVRENKGGGGTWFYLNGRHQPWFWTREKCISGMTSEKGTLY